MKFKLLASIFVMLSFTSLVFADEDMAPIMPSFKSCSSIQPSNNAIQEIKKTRYENLKKLMGVLSQLKFADLGERDRERIQKSISWEAEIDNGCLGKLENSQNLALGDKTQVHQKILSQK